MAANLTAFSLHVGDDVLADLKNRLTHVRWPDEIPDNHWKYGTDRPYLKSLVEYWRDGYDWRRHEARLNAFKQYKAKLAGIDPNDRASPNSDFRRCRIAARPGHSEGACAIRKYKAVLLDHPIIGVDGLFILLIPFLSLGFALGGAQLRR